MEATLLVAEPDPDARRSLVELCGSLGHEVRGVGGGAALRAALRKHPIGVLLLAAELEDGEELNPPADLPPRIRIASPSESIPDRGGCWDTLIRPVGPAELRRALERIALLRALEGERDELRSAGIRRARAVITGPSSAAARLREQVRRIADNPRSTVLITGEAGVETELVARAIHSLSVRERKPFRVLDGPTSISPRFESSLFGTPLGEGLLAQAGEGTLFLREVTALGPEAQLALIPLLRDRVWRSIGSEIDRALETRLIASTERDLEGAVADGGFLEDLFYRLNVLTIRVPPLRERIDDLPLLAESVLEEEGIGGSNRPIDLSPAALELLAAHSWPGNLRELRLAVGRAALLAPGETIDPGHLTLHLGGGGKIGNEPREESGGGSSLAETRSLRHLEEELIRRVLEEQEGNRSRAARVLGIHRSTLYNKLQQYRIE
jgi:DNA-binding NtrC family response regulator